MISSALAGISSFALENQPKKAELPSALGLSAGSEPGQQEQSEPLAKPLGQRDVAARGVPLNRLLVLHSEAERRLRLSSGSEAGSKGKDLFKLLETSFVLSCLEAEVSVALPAWLLGRKDKKYAM